MVFVVDQDQLVARIRIGKADAAGTGPVSNPPRGALRRKRLVGERE